MWRLATALQHTPQPPYQQQCGGQCGGYYNPLTTSSSYYSRHKQHDFSIAQHNPQCAHLVSDGTNTAEPSLPRRSLGTSCDAALLFHSEDTGRVVSLHADRSRLILREAILREVPLLEEAEQGGGEDGVTSAARGTIRVSGRRRKQIYRYREHIKQPSYGSRSGHCKDEAVVVVDEDEDEDLEEIDGIQKVAGTVPIYSSQWRPLRDSLVSSGAVNLQRVRWNGLAADTTAVALSTHDIYLVDTSRSSDDEGIPVLQQVCFGTSVGVNAVAMDFWGPSASLVGFSDGTVRVYDWREPLHNNHNPQEDAGSGGSSSDGASLKADVPQPSWLHQPRRGRVPARTSVAGVLACCALNECYRVVCSLADQRGAVVVTDLRAPLLTTASFKRGRAQAEKRMLAGLCHVPTGSNVVDMQHAQDSFGLVAMVDSAGECVFHTIGELEGNVTVGSGGKRKRYESPDMDPAYLSAHTNGPPAMDAAVDTAEAVRSRALKAPVQCLHRRGVFCSDSRVFAHTSLRANPSTNTTHNNELSATVNVCSPYDHKGTTELACCSLHEGASAGFVSVSSLGRMLAAESALGYSLFMQL